MLRKFVLVFGVFAVLQGCSSSSENSAGPADPDREFRAKDQLPLQIQSLGTLSGDDSGALSVQNTGLKWTSLKDKVTPREFYQEAFRKGCRQQGQPQESLQIDPDLRVGQSFRMTLRDLGQGHYLTTVKRRTISAIDRIKPELVYTSEFLKAEDSRIADYRGPLVLENPFEKIKVSLGQSGLTGRPTMEFKTLEMKLHPELIRRLETASGSIKTECHLERNETQVEVYALGQIKGFRGKNLKATKKTVFSTGQVVCQRIEDAPFSTKNELEKTRGQVFRFGPGKNIDMTISSNLFPSPSLSFCGGTQILNLKVLVLDDGQVLQQRTDLMDEVNF